MTHPFSDEGLILRRSNYSEADRLLVVFTPHHGKFTTLAKGVRKTTSRKSPHIELFTHSKFHFTPSSFIPYLLEATTISSYSSFTNSLPLTKVGFHLLETLDLLLPENEPLPSLFHSTIKLLDSLNSLSPTDQDHRHLYLSGYYQRLLSDLGFGNPPSNTPTAVYSYLESIVLGQHLHSAKSFA